MTLLRRALVASLLLLLACFARANDLEAAFRTPSESAKPWVFWYWMHGAYSREGITADLEAMKAAGLGGAYLVPIKAATNPPHIPAPIPQLSPEWFALVKHACTEADRLGLKIAMHASDGFATAGGPWITPELSMQKLVWSEQRVEGGRPVEVQMPRPEAVEGFYRDVALLAFPSPEGAGISTRTVIPKVTTNVAGANPALLIVDGNTQRLRSEGPCWIQFEFNAPFTCRSIRIRPDGANYAALRPTIEASDDGVNFRVVTRLVAPRHGWQDRDADYTYGIPETTARFFRVVHEGPDRNERGSEDLDSAKWSPVFKVQQLELSSEPRITDFSGKSGLVWRRSAPVTSATVPPALCVPLAKVIDISKAMDADGRVRWTAPAGQWTFLRVGYTTTGHRNESAGTGKGLECDKLNPAAVRLQFDRWFGETIRQVGPELARRVLTVFHVDSWEAASQNWTPAFVAEFSRLRGYDPMSYLPAFAGVPVGSAEESEKFLHDVRRTIDDLTEEVFFATLAELSHAHGCTFTAEPSAPTMMGDSMRHFANTDVTMGEFWLRSPTHDKPNDMHDAISAAHVYGKRIVQAEAFTSLSQGWDEHPGMLKALGDRNFALGTNRMVLHVFTHNPWLDRRPGMTLDRLGLYFQRDQTWWSEAKTWMDYLARCSALLQTGRPVADVAYFAGDELPARAVLPERRSVPLPEGYAADTINADALVRLATVRDRRLVLPGGASYAALVLQDVPVRTKEVRAKLQQFERDGLAIIRHDATTAVLENALRTARVSPDLLVKENAGKPTDTIIWTHRSTPEADVYFISNQEPRARSVIVSVRNGLSGQPRGLGVWDPVTRDMRALDTNKTDEGRLSASLHIEAHGAVFLVVRTRATGTAAAATREAKPTVALTGPWVVRFDPQLGGPTDGVAFNTLSSWSEHSDARLRYYSGTAVYGAEFAWKPAGQGRVWLDLGRVEVMARVLVNGIDCGTAWTSPLRVEVTSALRAGANRVEIRVVNTWANRLIGDLPLPEQQRITWTTAPYRLEGKPLLPAGLLGPVQILEETQ